MNSLALAEAPLHHGPAAVRLYSRIREDIRARIVSGAWQPHDRLPSESELMGQYGVSRITVRQALSDLQKERVIFKVAGKGSFVSPAKPFQELGRLQGFAEAMGALGHDTYNRVLSVRTVPATEEVAQRLQLSIGERVTEIHRVRHVGSQPVSLDLTWLPLALAAVLLLTFVIQLGLSRKEELVTRMIYSIGGAVVILGVGTLVLWLLHPAG